MSKRPRVIIGGAGAMALIATALVTGPLWVWGQVAGGTDRGADDPPRVRATLKVQRERPRILFDLSRNDTDPGRFMADQAALLRARFVLQEALRNPRVAALPIVRQQEVPIDWLERELVVKVLPGLDLIQVSLQGAQNADTAAVLNAVIDAYMRVVVEKERTEQLSRYEYLQKLWARLQDELKAKRKHLKEMADSTAALDEPTVTRLREVRFDVLAQRVRQKYDAELSKHTIEARLKGAEKAPDIEARLLAEKSEVEALLSGLDTQIAQLQAELQSQTVGSLDLKSDEAAIAIAEETAREVGREVAILEVELQAPPRITVLDRATAPGEK